MYFVRVRSIITRRKVSLEQSLELVEGDLAIAAVVQRVNNRIDLGLVHMSTHLVQESLELLGLNVT